MASKRNGNGAHTLKLDPHNARKHPDRNKAQIAASLKELGAGRSILVDATDTIIAGNGVYEQAQALGYKVKVIEADGKTLIAVKRPDLKGAKARRMALADNRATETSEWDVDVLADLAANDADALAGLFDERELRDLLGDKMPGGKEETADAGELVDRAGELQKKWQVCRGDLFEVGRHRILCGDSTNAADVARLMQGAKARLFATDPPYGIDYDSAELHRNGSHYDAIQRDELKNEQYQKWLESVFMVWVNHLADNAAWYLWHPMLTQGYFAAAAAAAAVSISRQIIWVKPQFIFGRGHYHWQHELCFYGWRKGNTPPFYGKRNQTTIWQIGYNGERNKRDHPTAKPPELWDAPMLNHTKPNEVCAEPFSGSGAQLVKGEQLGRRVFACEVEPKYVAVALERLSLMGLTPKRVSDGNGKAKRKTKATA